VPKGSRLDWLLEKATELGAASLRPTLFDRSVAGLEELSPAKRERWFGHCVAAAKQSRLDFLPDVAEPAPLPAVLAARGESLGLLGDVEADALPLASALGPRRTGQEILVLVGPEGGLVPEERQSAMDAGFLPVRLGHTTLRVETAVIAILAAVSALCE
jgi:16S rRNA (uracil1498-N3)-methyltransferase